MSFASRRILLLCLAAGICLAPITGTAQIMTYSSRVPLGNEEYEMKPGGHSFYLMASSISPAFDGVRRNFSPTAPLISKDGAPLRFYPDRLFFRVTASTREKLNGFQPFIVDAEQNINDYLLHLHFRLKIFNGLQMRRLEPAEVQQIGMPADVNYDERIYGVSFQIGQVPIDRRVVLEVLSPNRDQIGKFHLDLY